MEEYRWYDHHRRGLRRLLLLLLHPRLGQTGDAEFPQGEPLGNVARHLAPQLRRALAILQGNGRQKATALRVHRPHNGLHELLDVRRGLAQLDGRLVGRDRAKDERLKLGIGNGMMMVAAAAIVIPRQHGHIEAAGLVGQRAAVPAWCPGP